MAITQETGWVAEIRFFLLADLNRHQIHFRSSRSAVQQFPRTDIASWRDIPDVAEKASKEHWQITCGAARGSCELRGGNHAESRAYPRSTCRAINRFLHQQEVGRRLETGGSGMGARSAGRCQAGAGQHRTGRALRVEDR